MEDQYENLSKIAQMLVLIEKLKLSGNLRDAQVWEQKLFQLMQKRQQEREQADFFKYVGSTDDETDNNIFNAVLPLIRNEILPLLYQKQRKVHYQSQKEP